MYALNLNEENRILSVTFDEYAPPEHPRVDLIPAGDVYEYKYINGEYIHDSLPKPEEPEQEATIEEVVNVLLGVK